MGIECFMLMLLLNGGWGWWASGCLLYFNRSQKYVGLFDQEKNETRHAIESVDDIYGFAEQPKATAGYYE